MISVIIPFLTEDRGYLVDCVKSILKQTYMDYEIIRVEDTDRKGACWARNQGLWQAQGDYIFFCDADVTLHPECFSEMYSNISEADWVYCNYQIGEELHRYQPFSLHALKRNNLCSTMSLIKADIAPEWDESIERFQDWDYFLNLAFQGYKGKWIDKVLFTTPKREGISTKGNKRAYKKIILNKWNI